jgi:arginine/ornithine transport system permease protein
MVGAIAKLSGRSAWVALATAYTTVIRGIPDLVLMLLIFYGGTIGMNNLLEWLGSEATVDINPFVAGVLTLGFIYGAYMTETFRGAMLAIPVGQVRPPGSRHGSHADLCASPRPRWCATPCPALPTTGWC